MNQRSYDSLEVDLNMATGFGTYLLVSACPYSHQDLTLHSGLLSVFLSRDRPACSSWQEIWDHWARTLLRDDRNGLGKLCGMQIDGQFG